MDPRLLDILCAVIAFLVFLVLVVLLPAVLEPAIAYMIAILVFLCTISGTGYFINKAIT
ncbi:MAG: hypothetical protein LUQ01_01170 [Methanolinea sp.]|nr:hypothetical protein [Methanolinea sp.]